MLFSSLDFVVFFFAYFILHLLIPHRYRTYLIICGSTIFYAWWKVEYVWLPYLLMGIAYGGIQWVDGASSPQRRRIRLIISLIALFLPLAIFKYTDFIYRDVLGVFFGWSGHLLNVQLPLGISFVTFTLTAFFLDIITGKFPPVKKPSTALAYVLFFPHLIAGPILRPAELIPQLEAPRRPILPLAAVAIFTLGLVKKLVFADSIAEVVDMAYAKDAMNLVEALIAAYGFSAQIYCDFSGYTDMAIGLAMLLGIRLPNNFARPYGALSPIDFWRRWHITLSHWLRDYLYIPLGGSRVGLPKQIRNIMMTMVLGGLWHGANWTFVIWGFLHGVGLSFAHIINRFGGPFGRVRVPKWLAIFLTFHFITFTWIFFRAPTFEKAITTLSAFIRINFDNIGGAIAMQLFPISLILIVLGLHKFDDHRRIRISARKMPAPIIWSVIAFGWILAIAVSQGSSAKFIYFDF